MAFDVTSAALSDVLPAGLVRKGGRLSCTATPFDDQPAGAAP